MDERILDRRIRVMREKERELIKQYGWITHYTFETEKREYNGLCNIHTHGLTETQNHLDLQIVIPLPQNIAHGVITQAISLIKAGTSFKDGDSSSEILNGADVYFRKFQENGRDVLRIILPDEHNKFPEDDDCDEYFKRQLEVLPD